MFYIPMKESVMPRPRDRGLLSNLLVVARIADTGFCMIDTFPGTMSLHYPLASLKGGGGVCRLTVKN